MADDIRELSKQIVAIFAGVRFFGDAPELQERATKRAVRSRRPGFRLYALP